MRLILALLIAMAGTSAAHAATVKALYFYRANCQWCQRFDAVLNDKEIATILRRNTDILRVDVTGRKKIDEKLFHPPCKVINRPDVPQTGSSAGRPQHCPVNRAATAKTERDLVDIFKIKQTPTLVFVSSEGEELLRIPGFLPKEDLLPLLLDNVPGITR